MNDLNDLTIIIPIKIESLDRYNNIKTVLSYINNYFITNVIIIEESEDTSKLDFLSDLKNLKIDHTLYIKSDVPFHRTKYLNEMLSKVKTKVVANYDSDIFLPVSTYINVVDKLVKTKIDFIYPYKFGKGQKQLYYSKWYEHPHKEIIFKPMVDFLSDFNPIHFEWDIDELGGYIKLEYSSYGHSVFAKTASYRNAYGENEDFISWGPEDQERAWRFKKLGYKIDWYNDYVYHIEHQRSNDSNKDNPYFIANEKLFNDLQKLNRKNLIEYYSKKNYADGWFTNNSN